MKEYRFNKESKAILKTIDKRLAKLFERVLKLSHIDFEIVEHGGYRSAQVQNNLYHTKVDGKRLTQIDGFKIKSPHQDGKAIDVYVRDEHGDCQKCLDKYKDIATLVKSEFQNMVIEDVFSKTEFIKWGGNEIRYKNHKHFEITSEI